MSGIPIPSKNAAIVGAMIVVAVFIALNYGRSFGPVAWLRNQMGLA